MVVFVQRKTFFSDYKTFLQPWQLHFTNCEKGSDKIKNLKNLQLNCAERKIIAELLYDICEDCAKMAALPQGAFAACKLRDMHNDRDMTIARMKTVGDKSDPKNLFENKKQLEYSPAKYNGKLMNSIWGLYNRYSPHNIKSNDFESDVKNYFKQQPTAVASYAIAQNMRMAIESGNEWSFSPK